MTPRKTGGTAGRGVKPPSRSRPRERSEPASPPRAARRPAKRSAKKGTPSAKRTRETAAAAPRPAPSRHRQTGTPADVEAQLLAIENDGGDGELDLGKGTTLHVSSLGKAFFPEVGTTKGAVMRYYARVSRFVLPDIEGRPLILKRYPDGVGGPMFFQQDAGAHVPAAVRVDSVLTVDKGRQDRIIGGDLATLLYTVQLGAIEIHPWFSRIRDIDAPDRALIDLDPGEGVPFPHVVELAQEIVRIARQCALPVALKTSGSRGIHLVFPLPPSTTYETSAQLAGLIAKASTIARPDLATVERSIKARPGRSIYVDAMQNAHGKSMASAYSIRARASAPVSAPLRPRELTPRLRIGGFTARTMAARTERVGDIWREALAQRPTAGVLARGMQILETTLGADPPKSGRRRR